MLALLQHKLTQTLTKAGPNRIGEVADKTFLDIRTTAIKLLPSAEMHISIKLSKKTPQVSISTVMRIKFIQMTVVSISFSKQILKIQIKNTPKDICDIFWS